MNMIDVIQKSILDHLSTDTVLNGLSTGTAPSIDSVKTLTYEQLKNLAAQFEEPETGEDDPYAILLSQEKFNMLVQSKAINHFDNSCPTEKVVAVLYGMPVIIQDIFEYKVLTKREYTEFFNAQQRKQLGGHSFYDLKKERGIKIHSV